MLIGKFNPDCILPQTWASRAKITAVAITSTFIASHTDIGANAPVVGVYSMIAAWAWNQWRTRDERDGYFFDSPLDSALSAPTPVNNEVVSLLRDYGFADAHLSGAIDGPVLTRYLVRLPRGAKLGNKLSPDDMARDLGVPSVHIQPNAGKGLIGIDVPAQDRTWVRLGTVLESKEWLSRPADMMLPVCPSVDQFGVPVVFDLHDLPHIIVAGTTGSGKSVFVNAMLLSLIYSGADFRLMIADGKKEDFANIYTGFKKLLDHPMAIATEVEHMSAQIMWLTEEMDRRFDTGDKPYPIVFVVDELADIVMRDEKGKPLTKMLSRLAQKARAANIHMILITQYPTVEVVDPLIAANTPSRAGLLIDKEHQSRVVIGDSGCETLQGKGDCFLKIAGQGTKRVHGVKLDDSDFSKIVGQL